MPMDALCQGKSSPRQVEMLCARKNEVSAKEPTSTTAVSTLPARKKEGVRNGQKSPNLARCRAADKGSVCCNAKRECKLPPVIFL